LCPPRYLLFDFTAWCAVYPPHLAAGQHYPYYRLTSN
jgi:hypothetical protein